MEATVNNLIKALGWSIFHSLWQSALIYVLLFVVLMTLPKLNAKLKHNIAFGSLLLMFASFCFTFYSVFELPITQVKKIDTIAFIAQAKLQDLRFLNSNGFLKTEAWFPLITGFYIFGIGVQLLLLLSGYQKLKQLKKSSTVAIPAGWNEVFQTILTQLKINKPVKFFLSTKVNVPLVIGYFKPVVLFPIALAAQLELKQVEAILIHELSHIRRNDYALNLIKTTIETLLFFNPFVWLAGKFIGIEREHACDDLVVKHTGTPLTYAHTLLKLELLKDKQTPVFSLAVTGNNQHLYQRIKRITNMKTTYMNSKQQFFIVTATLATIACLAWISPKEKEIIVIKKAKNLSSIIMLAIEGKPKTKTIAFATDTDTVKVKKSFRMVSRDKKGKEIVYTSIDEIPDSLKKKMLEMEKQFNSPEWIANIAKMEENAKVMEKQFNSTEWKANIAKMEENAKVMEKKFNSPEWKANIAKMEENAKVMEKKFNSPEWKQKMEEMKKLQELPEFKDLKNKFDKDLEALKKLKGIK